LTGTDLWWKWLDGLRFLPELQDSFPGLFGSGARYVPYAVYVALAVVAVLVALRARGLESLARWYGDDSGLTVALRPRDAGGRALNAELALPWLWMAIGFMSMPTAPQWILTVGVVAFLGPPTMRRAELTSRGDRALPAGARDLWPAPA